MVRCTNPEHQAVLLVEALHIHIAVTPLNLGRLPVNLLLKPLLLVLHLEAIESIQIGIHEHSRKQNQVQNCMQPGLYQCGNSMGGGAGTSSS